MPSVAPGMVYRGSPELLVDYGVHYSLGWQDHRKAGPSIVLVRLRWFGGPVKGQFPLTEQGWANAWRALCSADPSAAAAIAAKLARQAERHNAAAALAALDQQSLCYLPRVTFKGGSGGSPLAKDQVYILRFLGDQISVSLPRQLNAVLSIPYRDVDSVEVNGPGKVGKQLSQVLVLILGLGLLGALLGLFVLGLAGLLLGAVLFGLIGALAGAASTTVESIVRIRASDADLYFLNAEKEPDALRIELASALAAIDTARGAPREEANGSALLPSASIPDQLGKLASLLEQGTITRDEFEHLKAKLIASL
ncbi:MAG TPA: SHOCT domain-containing protein [Streptosporangiaceae bacterium]|nr:SHOCT domain-containing protein [Streptosporangiaceae bacterium]